MRAKVDITGPASTEELPKVKLEESGGEELCKFWFVDFDRFQNVAPYSEVATDFFLLAASVYCLDRNESRDDASDNWTRDLELTVPVSDTAVWSGSKGRVENLLSFLTGDRWVVEFTEREANVFVENEEEIDLAGVEAASLFSGGLDSFVGVVDWLEQNPASSLLLVGHRDPNVSGPKGDQLRARRHLKSAYNGRTQPLFVGFGPDAGVDTSLRSRSLLFIGLGICAASKVSSTAPLLMPENGTIALNPPLTPSRSGSCSTRTAHPHYLSEVNNLLEEIGLGNRVENPLSSKTKGEVLSECENDDLLKRVAHETNSCAKRNHTRTWVRREASQCGRCMPCIYRRAALHQIGEDNEVYGLDICTGEVDVTSGKTLADDFRACLSFLNRSPSIREIKSLLVSNGRLEIAKLDDYAGLVVRAMDEIRDLLREKATDDIKARAGLA